MKTFLLILVTIVWGSTFFIIKDTVSTVNEFFIVFIRSIQAFIVMLIYQLYKNPKQLINLKAIYYGLIMGLLMAITYGAQTIGLKYTSTGHSAFISSSAVIIIPISLFLFYKMKLVKIDIIAVIILFAGLFLLTYDFETSMNIGDIITIATAFAYAFHVILAGRFVKKADTTTLITYQFLGASIVSLLAFFISNNDAININPKAWISLLYLGLIGTLFCYFVMVWVQEYVSSLKVAIVFSLEPVFAAIIGYFAINEILNTRELMGASLILLGVVVHSVLKNRNKLTQTE